MDVKSELRDAQLEIKSSDNAHDANRKGLIWFNTAADKVKAIYNSVVEILATESWVSEQITNSESSLKSNGLITDELASNPATPAAGEAHIYAKNGGIFYKDDAGNVEQFETVDGASQRVLDMYTVEVNIDETGYDSGSKTITAFNVPSGYRWSFVGTGVCFRDGPTTKYNLPIRFDSKTFVPTREYVDSNFYDHIPVGIMGSGTNTGNISVTFAYPSENSDYRQLIGIAFIYKKQ